MYGNAHIMILPGTGGILAIGFGITIGNVWVIILAGIVLVVIGLAMARLIYNERHIHTK